MYILDQVQCPLCLVAIEPANDEGWKLHLMTGEGCSKLKKSRSPNKKKPVASAAASATATTTTTKRRTIKK